MGAMQEWFLSIEDKKNIKEWVVENGTDMDKEFVEMVTCKYSKDKSRVSFRYLQEYSFSTTSRGLPIWDDYNQKLRECRGITFDTDTGDCICYPFDKFFEIDQVAETSLDKVKEALNKANLIEFSEKLDGSLIAMRYYNGSLVVSSMSTSDSPFIEEVKKDVTPEIERMCQENPNCTFIFEELERYNAHVVQYKSEDLGLYLLAYRNMRNGVVSTYRQAIEFAEKYGVRHTVIHETTLEQEVKRLAETTGLEREGCVINIDGWRVKLKGEDYLRLHRIITGIGKNELIQRVADGTLDEVRRYLCPEHLGFVKMIEAYCDKINQEIDDKIAQLEKDQPDRLYFFHGYLDSIPEKYHHALRQWYTKKERVHPLILRKYKDQRKYQSIEAIETEMLGQKL